MDTGWAFPVDTDGRGDIETASGETDIRQAIRVILGTAKGERVMRPEFGCAIHDQVFASLTPATLATIERDVRAALDRWEPRIEVESVETETAPERPGVVRISITYRVRSLDQESTLVYRFDTGEVDR